MPIMVNSRKKSCPGAGADAGYFSSGSNELAYSCMIPTAESRPAGILFVHAADGNRLGPHRMFVELARSFNSLGYPTLRFDLRGCGDSTGSSSDGDISAETADVLAAADFFIARAKLERVILCGISRGAFVCHQAMTQHQLALGGMILLSPPVSSGKAALRAFEGRLKEYVLKLKDGEHLRKLLSGRADIRQIGRTLLRALGVGRRYRPIKNKGVASQCPILLIYGGQDPIRGESMQYYTKQCHENGLACRHHTIAHANHSFFHYKWKERVIELSRQWLDETQR